MFYYNLLSLSLISFAIVEASAVTDSSAALRGSERELTWSIIGGCAYTCPANSKFQTSWRRSLTWMIAAPQCDDPTHRQLTLFWWPKTTCPCSFDDCVCSIGMVKLGGACVYPSKPVPVPVAKPVSLPVAKPYPMPVAKPTPMPVAKPYPMPVAMPYPMPVAMPTLMPVAKPYSMPVAKPYPMPVAKPTPMPVAKPTPMPVAKPTPMPVAKPIPMPVAKPYPMPVDKPFAAPTLPKCQLEAIGGCDSCECPSGTHRGAHVQCLDTLNDCFCDKTNDNADRNQDCILN